MYISGVFSPTITRFNYLLGAKWDLSVRVEKNGIVLLSASDNNWQLFIVYRDTIYVQRHPPRYKIIKYFYILYSYIVFLSWREPCFFPTPRDIWARYTFSGFGEKPMECINQPELDKSSELDNVRDVFSVIGLDPHKLDLRLCEQDPPNCQSFDVSGKLVGWEVTGLYDPEVETNAGAKPVKDMVFRYWTEEELVAKIARTITVKDSKIAKRRAENSTWPFTNVNLVIPTDEITITREMADSMQGRFCTLDANNLNEVYLLLSYDPAIKGRPLIQIR